MEKTPYVGPFLRIIASVYDCFLLLGVWFLVGSLALWLNGGENTTSCGWKFFSIHKRMGVLCNFLDKKWANSWDASLEI